MNEVMKTIQEIEKNASDREVTTIRNVREIEEEGLRLAKVRLQKAEILKKRAIGEAFISVISFLPFIFASLVGLTFCCCSLDYLCIEQSGIGNLGFSCRPCGCCNSSFIFLF